MPDIRFFPNKLNPLFVGSMTARRQIDSPVETTRLVFFNGLLGTADNGPFPKTHLELESW